MPAPVTPAAPARGGLLAQFTGNALYGILIGIATIAVPLIFNRVYYVLPIAGILVSIYAIVRRQYIGGIVALVLNVIGGAISIIGLTGG